MGIMRTKSIEQSIRDTEEPEFKLNKSLGPLDLTVFGIGVIIGTGLFVLTGEAAAGYAGPAIALSYVVAGLACALAALCYAEFSEHRTGRRERLHVLLRRARGVRGVVDRVGPYPGIHARGRNGRQGLVRVLRQRLRASWDNRARRSHSR